MNNWIRYVGKKIVADVGFFYLPTRIVAVIPKTALENNTVLLQKYEDEFNVYFEFKAPAYIDNSIEGGKKLTMAKNLL
jgi:hypothetical protein